MAVAKHLHHRKGPPRELTVTLLVEAVKADRIEFGTCTTGSLIRRTGYSHQLVVMRVAEALETGKLIRAERLPGSLRPPGTHETHDGSA